MVSLELTTLLRSIVSKLDKSLDYYHLFGRCVISQDSVRLSYHYEYTSQTRRARDVTNLQKGFFAWYVLLCMSSLLELR